MPVTADGAVGFQAGNRSPDHRFGALPADGAVFGQQFLRNSEQPVLQFVAVDHDSAFEHLRNSRQVGQAAGDQAAGTGFGCDQLQMALSQQFDHVIGHLQLSDRKSGGREQRVGAFGGGFNPAAVRPGEKDTVPAGRAQ